MAKLGIALLILIVACGAQGSAEPSFPDDVESSMNVFQELIELAVRSAEEKLQEAVGKLKAFVASETTAVHGTAQSTIEKWEKEVKDVAEVSDTARKCIASSIDFKETAKTWITDVTTCLKNSLGDLDDEYDAILSSIKNFMSNLSDVQNDLKSCTKSSSSSAGNVSWVCYAKVIASSGKDIVVEGRDLLKKIASLFEEVSGLQAAVRSCATSSAIAIFKDAAKSIAEIKECIANAKSQ